MHLLGFDSNSKTALEQNQGKFVTGTLDTNK